MRLKMMKSIFPTTRRDFYLADGAGGIILVLSPISLSLQVSAINDRCKIWSSD